MKSAIQNRRIRHGNRIKIINIACNAVGPDEPSTKMATKVFELIAELENLPTDITIGFLKKELQALF